MVRNPCPEISSAHTIPTSDVTQSDLLAPDAPLGRASQSVCMNRLIQGEALSVHYGATPWKAVHLRRIGKTIPVFKVSSFTMGHGGSCSYTIENSRVPPTAFAATEANRRPVASAPRPQPGFPGPGPSSSGHASIQPFRNPTAPSTPTPFSPNTQASLSEFVNLPTPLFETTYDFSGSDTQNGESHGGYSDMKVDASSMSTRPSTSSAAFNGGPDTIAADVYNQFASTFQPSGYGLWDMSGFIHQSANWEAFQAMAPPAFGPPLEALQESGTEPPIAPIPLTKQASKAPPVPSASASDALTETSDPLHRLFLPVPTTSSAQDTKVIDVPPFLRQKLVQSYCYNAKRFPTIHFNRLKFRDRLLLGLESDLHPAFVYSSVSVCVTIKCIANDTHQYLMGATLHDEPTVRDFQDNFFEIAKSEFYRGMAAGTHHLDLIRAAMDMMIYLLMQGRGEAVVFGNQAAMYAYGGVG